jgi:hypothetical protein
LGKHITIIVESDVWRIVPCSGREVSLSL